MIRLGNRRTKDVDRYGKSAISPVLRDSAAAGKVPSAGPAGIRFDPEKSDSMRDAAGGDILTVFDGLDYDPPANLVSCQSLLGQAEFLMPGRAGSFVPVGSS